jgi:hypothetical protein
MSTKDTKMEETLLPYSFKFYNYEKHQNAILVPYEDYVEILETTDMEENIKKFRKLLSNHTCLKPEGKNLSYILIYKEKPSEYPRHSSSELLGYSTTECQTLFYYDFLPQIITGSSNLEIIYRAYMITDTKPVEKFIRHYQKINRRIYRKHGKDYYKIKAIMKNNKLYVRLDTKMFKILTVGNVYGANNEFYLYEANQSRKDSNYELSSDSEPEEDIDEFLIQDE